MKDFSFFYWLLLGVFLFRYFFQEKFFSFYIGRNFYVFMPIYVVCIVILLIIRFFVF